MRTFRGMVAIAATATLMLAGTAAVSAQPAQSEAITGTLELASQSGATGTHAWHANDARLDGVGAVQGEFSFYDVPSGDPGDIALTDELPVYEISTLEGTWRCLGSSPGSPEPDGDAHRLVFDGTGAYDGLTAVVAVDWSASPITFGGVILDDDIPVRPTLAG